MDSLQVYRKITVAPEKIPLSQAKLEIPVGSLYDLPERAVYMEKSGQATAKIEMKGDTILLTAICDSLQHLVYTYETELAKIKKESDEQIKETKPIINPFKWFIYGLLAGMILVLLLKKYR